MKTKIKIKATCSACGAPIKTSILRQCPRCIRERRGV